MKTQVKVEIVLYISNVFNVGSIDVYFVLFYV